MRPPITDKKQMYELLRKGAFGNTFRTWTSLDAFLMDSEPYDGQMGVRCAGAPGSPFITDLEVSDAIAAAHHFEAKGHTVVLYEASPKKWITIQGEVTVTRGYNQWWLEYNTQKMHMRKGFAKERLMLCGDDALFMIRRHFWEPSYEELLYIFDQWPGHVAEFSAYSVPVGQLSGRNVQWWEVRDY